MKSEGDIVAALDERTRALQPGSAVDLDALSASDPFGADAFASLAARFGVAPTQAGWTFQRAPRWRPGWLQRDNGEAFFDLFESAFGYRMDARLWAWKYRDTAVPGMGAWKDGRMIAFFGAMPRPVLMFGKPESCVQICDVMVHPTERGVMTRSGALLMAAASYIERSVGYGRPHLFGFGFPTSKHLLLAQKLGLYEQVDQISELVWPAGASWASRMLRVRSVQAKDAEKVDRLWKSMAQDFRGSILGVRDAAFLKQRFAEHPTVDYDCLLVRKGLTGTPLGIAVVRLVDAQLAELVDVIGPRRNFASLVGAARAWAQERGAAKLRTWVTSSHANVLSADAVSVTLLDIAVPANVWTSGPSPDELRGRWWLMAGDTDFR